MSAQLNPEMQRVQIVIRPKYGTLAEEDRQAIARELRDTNIGQVRVDEAIVFNAGIGGPGAPITIDVWLSIAREPRPDC